MKLCGGTGGRGGPDRARSAAGGRVGGRCGGKPGRGQAGQTGVGGWAGLKAESFDRRAVACKAGLALWQQYNFYLSCLEGLGFRGLGFRV